jgi:hypothetical protein
MHLVKEIYELYSFSKNESISRFDAYNLLGMA